MATIEELKAMRIGCDNVVWAKLLTDDGTNAPTFDTPVELPGVMALNINPNSSIETAFYDDGPGEVATTLGNIEVSFNKSTLGPKEKAVLLGKTYLANAAVIHGVADTPPWGAIGFRSLKGDGTYRYVWLYKGKFTDPADNNETKGDSINFQSDEITGRFVKLNYKVDIANTVGDRATKKRQVWKVEFDETSVAAAAAKVVTTKWFAKVPTPGVAIV